jgi:hypothetical protein
LGLRLRKAGRQAEGDVLAGDEETGTASGTPFMCATCGRTDCAPAGDWDPPICVECDAEISFAAIEEVEMTDDR